MRTRDRKELGKILRNLLGSPNVYFRKPSKRMGYPCILYNLEGADNNYADNIPYLSAKRYSLTYIDKDPDSEIPDMIADLQHCRFDRTYEVDNMNHWVFTIYF